MQDAFSLRGLKPLEFEEDSAFSVVIAYEDFEMGTQARKTYDYLVEHLGDQCLFSNQMWKFDVLAVPKLREMAADDAAGADIIIVAAHGGTELPAAVQEWIDLWLAKKTRVIALVAMFGADRSFENPARAYLANVARRAQIEFFSQPDAWPGKEEETEHSLIAWERNGKTFSLLAGMAQQDRGNSHDRINE